MSIEGKKALWNPLTSGKEKNLNDDMEKDENG